MRTGTFNCKGCGAVVERPTKSINRGQKYCSPHCFYASGTKAKSRVCRNCGATFTNRNALRYCGSSCFQEFIAKRKTTICAECKQPFQQMRPSLSQKYCSKKCEGAARTLPPRVFDCAHCGKSIAVRMVRNCPRKFCSKECQYAHTRGENHCLFRGNRRGYRGANWLKQASAARLRDGGVCQGCGAICTEKASVDHVVPFRLTKLYGGRENKDPNDLRNLLSLCRSCHSKKTQAERKLLKGDMIGFITAVKCFLPIEKVQPALAFWGF